MNDVEFDEWLSYGYQQGWIGPPICETHDGMPLSFGESNEFEDGGDPCIHILRLYEDLQLKKDVELNHAPSFWRASNLGLNVSE